MCVRTALQSQPFGLLLWGAPEVALRKALDGLAHSVDRHEQHLFHGGDLLALGLPVVPVDNHGIELLLELGACGALGRAALGAASAHC